MARMRAIDAAVAVLRKEGIDTAFGIPGAAINPLYSALRVDGGIRHILARHVGCLAHGRGLYPCQAGNIGVHRHLRPGRHRHDHRPVLGIRRLHSDPLHHRASAACPPAQEDFGPWTSSPSPSLSPSGRSRYSSRLWSARVPAGLPRDALRPPRPGADRPAVRRADGRDRVRRRHLRAAAGL